jgi:hypothetical protein
VSVEGQFPAYRTGACVLDAAGNLIAIATTPDLADRIVRSINLFSVKG